MFYVMVGMKLVTGFVCFLLYINLSGRAQLAPHSAVDQIGNYVLGGIIGGVIYNADISIVEMLVVIVIWSGLILILRYIRGHNRNAKAFIDGRSIVLYDNGGILDKNLQLSARSVRDFITGMHLAGVHRLEDLQTVWLETNGQYTILKKGEKPFPIAMIEDGQIVRESLTGEHDEAWLLSQLRRQGFEDPGEIVYAEWNVAHDEAENTLTVYPYAGEG